jgi:hypothetical protein
MNNDDNQQFSSEISPVGWYIGSYQLRFVELNETGNDDPDASFLVWKNTVIVRAEDLEKAFRKVESIGLQQTRPYLGGSDSVPVQWTFEGITSLLPIYEALEDGAEIMWEKHDSVKLSELRGQSVSLEEILEHFRSDKAKRDQLD